MKLFVPLQMGLIVASLIGGPIAHYLIERHKLHGDEQEKPVVDIVNAFVIRMALTL